MLTMHTFSEENEKGSSLKENKICSQEEANSFFLEGAETMLTKLSSLTGYQFPLNDFLDFQEWSNPHHQY